AHLQDLHFKITQVDRHFAIESDGGPGQPGRHRLYIAEQPRKTGDFAGFVLFAALDDQVVGVAAGDDFLGVVSRSTQHAHSVIVGKQDVFDGLVGDFFNTAYDILCHDRSGLGVDDHDGVVANNDVCVGVAVCCVRLGVV